MKLFLLVLLFVFSTTTSLAKFAPDNPYWIGPDDKGVSNVTAEDFNVIIDDLEEIYAPVVRLRGGELNILRKWNNGTVNAYAVQYGSEWRVAMFGGLARHSEMTPDGFAMVLCHELGHHLGGAIKYPSEGGDVRWASAEGQSDYFAATKCMKLYFENKDNLEFVSQEVVPQLLKDQCESVYGAGTNEYAICVRTGLAGKALGNTLAYLSGLSFPNFNTPDKTIVKQTINDDYPSVQCRLDTYFSGSLCNVDPTIDSDNYDARVSYCNASNGDTIGFRPECWYKDIY